MPRSRTPLAERRARAEQERIQAEKCLATMRRHKEELSRSAHERHGISSGTPLGRILTACKNTKLLVRKEYMCRLKRLAKWNKFWIRPPEDWDPRTKNPDRQFSSLARHLLAKYEVPAFMDSAWGDDEGKTIELAKQHSSDLFSESVGVHQEWFVKVGQGENIRKQRMLPIPLTKRMAHEMMGAPPSLTVTQAVRWGQVVALGGDKRCAEHVIGTSLGRGFRDGATEAFWESVIRFFVANPMLDATQYGPIIDYVEHQRFAGDPPLQPNFSMHGRSPETLVANVEGWHKDLAKKRSEGPIAWSSCGIDGMEWVEGQKKNETHWSVRELLTAKDLRDEGRIMRHCVGSYTWNCDRGVCAIYSLARTLGGKKERRLTIEVAPKAKQVVQARGFFNEMPTDLDKRSLQKWASQAGLIMSKYM